ncbi:hypothetical protein DW641_02835 [Dorea longicatena]|uniref:Uncharacterized protein n=1 Tax=Dorea longicatena TaxID=88431 RepID=A0A414S4F7_9FIRM|nr:DUF6339 family protein [Dorea longicatena]RHG10483.1 hypothetical protein DW641_02835 [Dorea longicatena]
MIQYKKFTKAQAREFIKNMDELPEAAFEDVLAQWSEFAVIGFDESYNNLRKKVIETYREYKDAGGYEIDIRIGLCLYEELSVKNGFTNVLANDDDIWRYLSCKVFPDITYLRYPPSKTDKNEGHRLNTKRFYSHTRRIWLKTLWWYIHLSWQGTKISTYKIIKDYGTDTISDFIERPGKGYRLDLYRALMREYSKVPMKSSNLFNRIQKQNLVNCRSVEPALTEGAEDGYAKRLIEQSID